MNTSDIRQIAMHQRLRGIAIVEIAQDDSRVRLHMSAASSLALPADLAVGHVEEGKDGHAPGSPLASDDVGLMTVVATALGLLRLAHPSRPSNSRAVGDQVGEGEALALLQVGQAFTEISAPCAGRVEEILAHEGQCIDYGKPLFTLRCGAS